MSAIVPEKTMLWVSLVNILSIHDFFVPDPLKEAICKQINSSSYCQAAGKVKDVLNFLKWKINRVANDKDKTIIEGNHFDKFGDLSVSACSYTKGLIKRYAEVIWQSRTNSIYQLDGYQEAPEVNSSKIIFPRHISRTMETLTMSMFYPNNLFYSFLFRYDSKRFTSPECKCGRGEQNAFHILLYCKNIRSSEHAKAHQILSSDDKHSLDAIATQPTLLLSWSRSEGFLQMCYEMIEKAKDLLLKEITL